MSESPDNTPAPSNTGATPQAANHDAKGKFRPGNKAGKGNPYAATLSRNRSEFIKELERLSARGNAKAVSIAAKKLMEKVLAGEPWAIREMLDRLMGKPTVNIDPLTIDSDAIPAAFDIFYAAAGGRQSLAAVAVGAAIATSEEPSDEPCS